MVDFIVSDLDGTLLNSQKKLSKFNFQILKELKFKNKNIKLIIASGKNIYSIKNIIKNLEIDYFICLNGAKIFNKNNSLIHSISINFKICEKIIEKALLLNLKFFASIDNEIYHYKMEKKYTSKYIHMHSLKVFSINNSELIKGKSFEKIVFIDEKKKLNNFRIFLEKNFSEYINIFFSEKNVLDIVNKKCNKGTALKFIADYENFNIFNGIGFGDNENDISMLKLIKYPIIMENTELKYKNNLFFETLSNNNDGVGIFLKNFFNLNSLKT